MMLLSHSSIITIIYLIHYTYYFNILFSNFGQSFEFTLEDRIFFATENCEQHLDIGNWCEWSSWSKCDLNTCTRLRQRECNCPAPGNWTTLTECKTIRPQNDYRVNNTIVKHTRHIRYTSDTKKECKIPVILEGVYYPDCFKPLQRPSSSEEYIDTVKSKRNLFCSVNKTEIGICAYEQKSSSKLKTKGMREYDVSACSSWRIIYHYSMENLPATLKYVHDSDSELGRKCTFEGDDLYPLCTYHTFYSEHTRSDYGRLNNMAYDIENCRFACAIHIQCKAIEFIYGVHCILAFHFDESVLQRSIGTIIELKPDQCDPDIKEGEIYPYTNAMSVLRV
ncbi:unnamed protein product [Trichobilharzia szidati]|nr:unnamed protein product [Trichobilharzia szidati]